MGLALLSEGPTGFWLCESLDSLLPISRWITESVKMDQLEGLPESGRVEENFVQYSHKHSFAPRPKPIT